MNFLYPAVLWALSLLAIPIIIHLFKLRRYKTVFFSDLRFLKAIQKQTKNRSQLKHLLVLAARLLALTALVFAFAQPFFPGQNTKQSLNAPVYIYLDNSPSMEAVASGGEFLNQGKLKIREIIDTYGENHNYKWITNSNLTPSRSWLNGAQLREETNALVTAATFVTLDEVLQAVAIDAQNYEGEKRIFMLSDFQETFLEGVNQVVDSTLIIYPIHLAEGFEIDNISIDSVWFESPIFAKGFEQQLFAVITNHGREAVTDLAVRLKLNETTKGTILVSIPPKQQAEVRLNFTPTTEGIVTGHLSIEDSPIVFDDEFFFVMDVQATRLVYHIYEKQPDPVIRNVIADEYARYETATSTTVDLELLLQADLIILEGLQSIPSGLATTIAQQVQSGKNLFWMPSENFDTQTYSVLSGMLGVGGFGQAVDDTLRVMAFQYDDPYLTGVFQGPSEKVRYPEVYRRQPIFKKAGVQQYALMTLSNGEPLFLRTANGGQVIQFAGNLDKSWGTLRSHPLLIPLLYQGVLYRQMQNPNYFLTASTQPWRVTLSDGKDNQPVTIQATKTVIPSQVRRGNSVSIFIERGPYEPGVYDLKHGEEKVGAVAINIPTAESATNYWEYKALTEKLQSQGYTVFPITLGKGGALSISLKELETGRVLWQYFLIFALLFFLVEALLLRFLK